jgi:hypothetical protein
MDAQRSKTAMSRSNPSGYTRFRRPEATPDRAPRRGQPAPSHLQAQSRMPVESAAVMSAVYGVDGSKFSSWEAFCVWCLLAGRATEVMVFQPGGELLAAEGDSDAELHQRLADALDRLFEEPWPGSAGGTVEVVTVAQGEQWLTGLRIEEPEALGEPGEPGGPGEPDVEAPRVGVLGPTPLFHDVRNAIVTQARHTVRWTRQP